MKAGLIGYPFAGKTTLFEAVAMNNRSGDLASVAVPDPRLDAICSVIQPKKRTPTTLELMDNAARMPEPGRGKPADFAAAARRVDVLIHVVREFDSTSVPFHGEPNPIRDQSAVETELILADLQLVENRLDKLAKSHDARKPGSQDYLEKVLFERIKPELESGTRLRDLEFPEDENEILSKYQMLSLKPMVVAINCAETSIGDDSKLEATCKDPVFRICAEVEREIAKMESADRDVFLQDLGISKPASESLIRAVYDALGLITFFTAGQNETKAWPLRRGASAVKAAGVVHTDIARGFIRAEVVHYADFEAKGSVKACYDDGMMKLEGKDYVVQDGDIINIRNKS